MLVNFVELSVHVTDILLVHLLLTDIRGFCDEQFLILKGSPPSFLLLQVSVLRRSFPVS